MSENKKYTTFEIVLDCITAVCIFIGIFNSTFILIWAILTLVFGIVCKKIGESKGLDYGFLVGWFLGILGLIVICVLPNNNTTISSNKYEDLEKLQKLKANGTITEIEFEIEKQKLLR